MIAGDILITRNAGDEHENPSPGFWNHAAICVGTGVVEAQGGYTNAPEKVIMTDVGEFHARYPMLRVLRLKDPNFPIDKMVEEAQNLIGTPYRMIASWFRFLRSNHGENCVSVVRKSYMKACGEDPHWRIPDDIIEDTDRFEVMDA